MRLLCALATAVALAGCGKPAPPAATSSSTSATTVASTAAGPGGGPADEVDPDAPVPLAPWRRPSPPAAAPPTPTPNLVILLNGQQYDPVIVAGWPVVVRLQFSSPDGAPWRLSGGTEPWSRLVRLAFAEGEAWPLDPVSDPRREVTLDGSTAAALVWTMPPEKSAALAPGARALDAVLDAPGELAGTWKGMKRVRTERVTVIAAPKRLPDGWSLRKAEVEIEYAYLREGAAAALARAEKAIKVERGWRLMSWKSRLLAELGRSPAALETAEEAVRQFIRENPRGCMPDSLLAACADLRRAVLEKK